MRICPEAAEVRTIVREVFVRLGVADDALQDLSETILIDEGRPCARSYRIANFMAMWLIDIGIVQFYDQEGNMLHRTNLLAEVDPRRMAA